MANSVWLDKLKRRNLIKFHKICGENSEIGDCICSEWKEKLIEMTSSYDPKDVFNADETGLFYRCVSDCTLSSFKSDMCHRCKKNKERLTSLLCANMDRSLGNQPCHAALETLDHSL